MENQTRNKKVQIDWMITIVPLTIVIALCILFFFLPEQSNIVLGKIRFFFGDTFGTYYLIIGLGIFILSLYIASSKENPFFTDLVHLNHHGYELFESLIKKYI